MSFRRSTVAIAAVCAVLTLLTVLRVAMGGDSAAPLPPGYTTVEDLKAEYISLRGDIGRARERVDRLRRRLDHGGRPPNVDGVRFGDDDIALPEHQRAIDRGVKRQHDDDSIFVSIASFRDVQCPLTIESMFTTAKSPARIFMGVIQQNEPEDIDCIPAEYQNCTAGMFCPSDNIRVRKVLPTQAMGPTYGRFVSMLMYRGEKYFMMIDSHNRFATHWDQGYIDMLFQTPSKRTVLSHYPSSLFPKEGQKEWDSFGMTTVMCNGGFLNHGFLRLAGQVHTKSKTPRLQPFAAAGLVFADAALLDEVPFDPHLDYLFDGEEILYSIRMWTSGWDIYAPSRNLIFHDYLRHTVPRVWNVKNTVLWTPQGVSIQGIRHSPDATEWNTTTPIVNEAKLEPHSRILKELDKYGLGKKRSLADYWKFAKLDPVYRISGNEFCKQAARQKD